MTDKSETPNYVADAMAITQDYPGGPIYMVGTSTGVAAPAQSRQKANAARPQDYSTPDNAAESGCPDYGPNDTADPTPTNPECWHAPGKTCAVCAPNAGWRELDGVGQWPCDHNDTADPTPAQSRQEPVGIFDVYDAKDGTKSYIQIKPEYADATSVKLYAAPPQDSDTVRVPRELLVAAKVCVHEMRDENKLHGHITDASAKWAIRIEPRIDAALAAAKPDGGKEGE